MPTNYLVNYHASSDTFDKVAVFALSRHAAYAAVTVAGLANRDERLGAPRQSRTQIEDLSKSTGLDQRMKAFGMWADWSAGRRGRNLSQPRHRRAGEKPPAGRVNPRQAAGRNWASEFF